MTDDQPGKAKKIGEFTRHFTKEHRARHRSERDELLEYFHGKLADSYRQHTKRTLAVRQVAVKTAHLGTKDLYYLKSVCDDAERRGKSFSMVFWSELKVRP